MSSLQLHTHLLVHLDCELPSGESHQILLSHRVHFVLTKPCSVSSSRSVLEARILQGWGGERVKGQHALKGSLHNVNNNTHFLELSLSHWLGSHLSLLCEVGQHDNSPTLSVVDDFPHVPSRGLHGVLSYDVGLLVLVALHRVSVLTQGN